MPRGPKKHLKRLNAPKHWMLDKLTGVFAPRPSPGPHKLRECLPLVLLLRNRFKFALTRREVLMIVMQRLIKVDGKVRTDITYPAGFQDVITIDKIADGNFRLLYDTKGRFTTQKITAAEAQFKLCKVKRYGIGAKSVPYIGTHDGRTIRYPDPLIRENDTVKLNLTTGKIEDYIKFDIGNLVMITGGRNLGRVGIIVSKEKHEGSFDIVHIKDAANHTFATRIGNVFVIGKGTKSLISLPKGRGIKRSVLEEAEISKKKAVEVTAKA